MREPRGSIPINPSGGLTGPGRLVDAICVRMLHDAPRQGTGHTGEIQLGGATVVGTFDVGGSETTHCLYVVGAGT
jgi:acetyl-CoA C-acetyltransferase